MIWLDEPNFFVHKFNNHIQIFYLFMAYSQLIVPSMLWYKLYFCSLSELLKTETYFLAFSKNLFLYFFLFIFVFSNYLKKTWEIFSASQFRKEFYVAISVKLITLKGGGSSGVICWFLRFFFEIFLLRNRRNQIIYN